MANNPQVDWESEIDSSRKALDSYFIKLSFALGELVAATARNELRLRNVENALRKLIEEELKHD